MTDKNNVRIAPSILSANFSCLGDEIKKVTEAGADLIHFDVMDNSYVPNLSFGPVVCHSIKKCTSIPIDVHLMVNNADALIPQFAEAGANIISFHCDTTPHLDRTLSLIHKYGCQAGIALNPSTPLSYLDYIIDKVDLILIMSVNPGFSSQCFIESSLKKINEVRNIIDKHILSGGKDIMLEVDGGVKIDNIMKIREAGANIFVAGSAIFGKENYKKEIAGLRNEINKATK